eukprot:gene26212-32120_t
MSGAENTSGCRATLDKREYARQLREQIRENEQRRALEKADRMDIPAQVMMEREENWDMHSSRSGWSRSQRLQAGLPDVGPNGDLAHNMVRDDRMSQTGRGLGRINGGSIAGDSVVEGSVYGNTYAGVRE